MTVADPYPQNLEDVDDSALGFAPVDPIVVALNRIAVAIERNTAALHVIIPTPGDYPVQTVQNRPQATLAALPPVQTVPVMQRPSCQFHGPDKVAPSTKGKGGFYCQAKASPGQPANANGYCTWHS